MSNQSETVGSLVVGGGLVGCGVAYYLAREGIEDIVLLEADVHGAGATGGSFGNVRQQFGTALEVECSKRGLKFWKSVEEQFGVACTFHRDGYLMVTAEEETAQLLQRHAQVQRDNGMPDIELLGPAQIAEIAPFLAVEDLLCGSYTPLDGHVMGMDGIAAYNKGARELGVQIRQHIPVIAVERKADGWHTQTASGEIVAERVIIAAGAGTRELVKPFGIDLDIRSVSHLSIITEPAYPGQTLPFTVDLDNGMAVEREGSALVLAMLGRNPAPANHAELIEQFFKAAGTRAPALQDLSISHQMTAYPTIGGDGHPYIGQVADDLWAIAFVGHGIMHGPPLAEAVALASIGKPDTTLDLSAWDLRRTPGERSVLWRRKATS
jgi:sarcosine oxidase subunit beta